MRGRRQERRTEEQLDAWTAARILGEVFEACGREPNTIPVEALSAYAVYRKERFSLQRGVLAAALLLFVLLPVLFVLPAYTVSGPEEGERGLPVYTISVRSLLPVGSVTARLRSHALPVYEADSRLYTVEPTRNGTMEIRVELVNRQQKTERLEVAAVDAHGPVLTGSQVGEDTVTLQVLDEGIGVDYREIYTMTASGQSGQALSWDAETGSIVLAWPEEPVDVYIPDYIGNTLHISLTFQN